jgi:hypothetical protein
LEVYRQPVEDGRHVPGRQSTCDLASHLGGTEDPVTVLGYRPTYGLDQFVGVSHLLSPALARFCSSHHGKRRF